MGNDNRKAIVAVLAVVAIIAVPAIALVALDSSGGDDGPGNVSADALGRSVVIENYERIVSCAPDITEAVIAAHKHQIAERPQNPDLHYRLGILLLNTGRMADAIAAFQNALQINPAFHRARTKLAVCLFETDQKPAALQQMTGPDCLEKDTLELHYKVALLYCDKLKFASSLLNLDRQMQNNFTHTDPTVNISIVLQNLGLLDRVTAMWDNLSETARHAIES